MAGPWLSQSVTLTWRAVRKKGLVDMMDSPEIPNPNRSIWIIYKCMCYRNTNRLPHLSIVWLVIIWTMNMNYTNKEYHQWRFPVEAQPFEEFYKFSFFSLAVRCVQQWKETTKYFLYISLLTILLLWWIYTWVWEREREIISSDALL